MENSQKYERMEETMWNFLIELRNKSERGCVVLAFEWMGDQITSNIQG